MDFPVGTQNGGKLVTKGWAAANVSTLILVG
jgi:hypothetical protein